MRLVVPEPLYPATRSMVGREWFEDVVFGGIAGLPAHVLLIHVVVVLVPLAALAAVPLTTQAGEWLERRVAPTAALRAQTRPGDGLLPWFGGLFLVCAVGWLVHRLPASPLADGRPRSGGGTVLRVVLIALTVVLAAGSVTQTYRIGELFGVEARDRHGRR